MKKRCPTCHQAVATAPKYIKLLELFSTGMGHRKMLTTKGMADELKITTQAVGYNAAEAIKAGCLKPIVEGGNVYMRTPRGNTTAYHWRNLAALTSENGNGHKTGVVKAKVTKRKKK